ncbi:MAG: hypothetical protein Q7T26_02850 [Dehalococcoidia bacterium]|nr:hypothetical protein [Dehalococcoidia bacterium]
MPIVTAFDVANFKLNWALHHLSLLDDTLSKFRQARQQTKWRIDETDERFYVLREKAITIETERLGLIAGDVIHNIRSSLDYIAVGLDDPIRYHPLPLKGKCRTKRPKPAFPISNQAEYVGKVIQCMPPLAQDIIKSLQIYDPRSGSIGKLLWTLNDAWNADKHRGIISVLRMRESFPIMQGIEYLSEDDEIVVRISKALNLKPKEYPASPFREILIWGSEGHQIDRPIDELRAIYNAVRDDVLPRFECFFPYGNTPITPAQ